MDLTQFSTGGFSYLYTDGKTQIPDVPPAEAGVKAYTSLADFSQAYIGANHQRYQATEGHYILLQYAYALDGSHLPTSDSGRTPLGKPFHGLLSEQIRDTVQLLYLEDEKYAPVFAEAPAKEFWPGEAQ